MEDTEFEFENVRDLCKRRSEKRLPQLMADFLLWQLGYEWEVESRGPARILEFKAKEAIE